MVVEMVPRKKGGRDRWHRKKIPQLAGNTPQIYTTYSPCRTWGGYMLPTGPETNIAPEKWAIPKGNNRIPTIHFQVQAVSFWEGTTFYGNQKGNHWMDSQLSSTNVLSAFLRPCRGPVFLGDRLCWRQFSVPQCQLGILPNQFPGLPRTGFRPKSQKRFS